MISERPGAANPWSPDGFERFIDYYPATNWPNDDTVAEENAAFADRWRGEPRIRSNLAVVLTPGLFSEWLPGCFAQAKTHLEAAGCRVLRTPVRTGRGVLEQAEHLIDIVLAWLEPGEPFVWCAHSKGGLDALWALHSNPRLSERCAAAVIVQPPVGASRVVERWLDAPKSPWERSSAALLRHRLVHAGVRDISRQRDGAITQWLESFEPVVPTLCAVSWSIAPTRWVDSFHRTLGKLMPGHAHDGQLLLVDQRLPRARIVGLPEIDHAQPVLGGHGFDAGRFWRTLVGMAASGRDQTR